MNRLKIMTVLGMFLMLIIFTGTCTNKHLANNEEQKSTGNFDSIVLDTTSKNYRKNYLALSVNIVISHTTRFLKIVKTIIG